MFKLISIFFFLLFNTSLGINEINIRNEIFKSYNKNNRPVVNISNNILLKYGLEINSLVFFNQKSENIELVMKNTLVWTDEYLTWNKTEQNPKYITVKNNMIWQPDLELYNAAKKPKLYNKNPIVKIYYNGTIEYIRYISYSFACKLNLEYFPYDEQKCDMLFGSWKYPKKILDIKPFNNDKFINFTISPKFSHNEWKIKNINVTHSDNEYKCCPGDLWPNSVYTITLKRNPHKYNILIVMSIFITLSALAINTIVIYNYSRTYILVFIPLTLIWLQIHTSSKIPVIENSTKLENIIMCCFFTTIISCFESGILYNILNNFYNSFLKYYEFNNFNKIKRGYQFNTITPIKKYNTQINNMNFTKLHNILKNIDFIFRLFLTILFLSSITILLSI